LGGELGSDGLRGKVFQGCVAKKLIAINFPKFAAPRMGAEYRFTFE